MLKPVKIPDGATDDRALSAAETTLLRSAIGALMWTGLTRPDLLAELSTLQGVMNKANVRHLKDANDLVAKAKRDKEAAIYYRNLGTNSYRIVCIHDASAATSTKNYAQEGVIVVLMADHFLTDENHVVVDDDTAQALPFRPSSATSLPVEQGQASILLHLARRNTCSDQRSGMCYFSEHKAG